MSQKVIHWRIAKVAKELANEAYELLAKENAFYERNRSQSWYVRRNWRHFIPFARQALTMVLAKDYAPEIALGAHSRDSVDAMKTEIYEALLIDGGFKASGQPSAALH
jgi:hypothetical protein